MAAGSHDGELTEVGPGTPIGELMRRYWHPIGLSEDATGLPTAVRIRVLRRLLREQMAVVADGGDPLNVAFKPGSEVVQIEAGQYFSS